MSADIIQFVPRPNPKRPIDASLAALDHMAASIFHECFPGQMYESSIGYVDTAPSEMPPHGPDAA